MTRLDTTSQLIGDIYDAALDPALWIEVLQKIADFVGGPASALVAHDTSAPSAGFYYSWGDDPHYSKLYFQKFVKLNPTIGPMALMQVGDVRSISTVLPFDEFRRSRLYLEWAKPQGYGDATLAVIEKSAVTTIHVTGNLVSGACAGRVGGERHYRVGAGAGLSHRERRDDHQQRQAPTQRADHVDCGRSCKVQRRNASSERMRTGEAAAATSYDSDRNKGTEASVRVITAGGLSRRLQPRTTMRGAGQ